MANTGVFDQIIILFLIMMLGFFIRKKNIINDDITKGLSELLINVTLPFMIISSFTLQYDSEMMIIGSKILIYSIFIHVALIFFSKILYTKNLKEKRQVLKFITVFSNVGFIGYPILYGMLGEKGVFFAAIFNIPFNLFLWTIGVMFFTGEKNLKSIKKVMVNPATIAVFIGIIIFRFSINLPVSIKSTFNMVGSITTPISMIVIGSMLAERNVKEIFMDASLYYGAFVRLVLIPFLIFIILKFIGTDKLIMQICVVLEAMPAAVITAIIAEKYDGDAVYASQSVFVTTVLSLITIPIIIFLLK